MPIYNPSSGGGGGGPATQLVNGSSTPIVTVDSSGPFRFNTDGSFSLVSGAITSDNEGVTTITNNLTVDGILGLVQPLVFTGLGSTNAQIGGGQGISISDGAAQGDANVVITDATGTGAIFSDTYQNNLDTILFNTDGTAQINGWTFNGDSLTDTAGTITCQVLSVSNFFFPGYQGTATIGIVGDGADPDIELVNNGVALIFSDGLGGGGTLNGSGSIQTTAAINGGFKALSGTNIDWSTANTFQYGLAGNTTFTFANSVDGNSITIAVYNPSTYTVTWPTVSWSGGVAPIQTVGAHTDVYTFVQMGSTIYGSVVQNF